MPRRVGGGTFLWPWDELKGQRSLAQGDSLTENEKDRFVRWVPVLRVVGVRPCALEFVS